MSLQSEPRIRQSWLFHAWAGTPRDLANMAKGLHQRLLPKGQFDAKVTNKDGEVRSTQDPNALATIQSKEKVDSVEIDINEHRDADAHEYAHCYVQVQLGSRLWSNELVCRASSESETNGMIEAGRHIIRPYTPWHTRFHRGFTGILSVLSVAYMFVLIPALVAVVPLLDSFSGRTQRALYAAAIIAGGVAWWPFAKAGRWLLPEFEIYENHPRFRRHAGKVIGGMGFIILGLITIIIAQWWNLA